MNALIPCFAQLSLERPTMIRYGIKNIRDLVGHKVPIDLVMQSAAVRFDTVGSSLY